MVQSLGLLLLRVGAGGMMLAGHGWDKLFHFSEKVGQFPDPLGFGAGSSLALAVFAEFFCSLLVILGVATRFAAAPLVVTMAVAACIVHADDPWQAKEFALVYALPFLTLIFTGGGDFSLDQVLWNSGSRRTRL